MFKKTLSAVLAVVMLVAVFAMIVPASADTTEAPKFENLYEFDAYATPNADSATGAVSLNENYALAKLISVNAGDKLYMAPAMMDQSYQMTAYKADGTVHTLQVKVAAEGPLTATAMNEIYTNTGILCYTVPEDVASVRVVVSQNFTDFAVITKNQEITTKDYVDYWEAKGVNIKALIGGGTYTLAPSALVDVSATGGKFFGRADNKLASATTTDNLVEDSKGRYYCTKGYIEVKEGDVVYFVGEKKLDCIGDAAESESVISLGYIFSFLLTLTDVLFNLLFDNKGDVTEACLHGVIDRIIDNNMACLVHSINLLQTAVAAAHSCGENNQLRIFHYIISI